jgi:lactoylglutathione lyase
MMIRALDADRSLDFYRRAFDLNVTGRYAFDGFELIYLNDKPGAFEIELTELRPREGLRPQRRLRPCRFRRR